RSSARCSTMIVSAPSGRCLPCCSQVPTGTMSRPSIAKVAAISAGRISLMRFGVPVAGVEEVILNDTLKRSLPAWGARGVLAPAAIAVALLATSAWLGEARAVYLAACLVATAVATVALRWTAQPAVRFPLALAVLALIVGSAIATRAQFRL